MKNESFSGKSAWGYVPLPEASADFIFCETPPLDGDKGRGRGLVTRGVFLGSGMFSEWNSFCAGFSKGSGYSRNRKVLQTIWQHMAPAGAAAASCTAATADCCQKRTHTRLVCVCVFVCNNRTRSISTRWRFDCADVACVTFLSVYFLTAVLRIYIYILPSNLSNNLHQQWQIKYNYVSRSLEAEADTNSL